MSTIIPDIDILKTVVKINAAIPYESVSPYINDALDIYIEPQVGNVIIDIASTGEDTTLKDKILRCLGPLTLALATNELGISFGDSGITVQNEQGKRSPANEAKIAAAKVSLFYRGMQALLKRAQKPTAVISASDAVAFGAMRAAHEAGIDIPGDLSLVGFDDGMLAAYSYPPLTSIRRPIGEMAAEGARQLLRLIEGESWPENTVCYPVRLSIKKSIRRLNATERK